ncbi:thiopurine S-methyltransferase [Terasakiella brassicae]|uniref:Thiopurine S-methyltransferase n=1 Tax=Terasakiella brassicae TaxID=1634917 RepID=A0A917BT79_9PROT|nr:thiopurine S-methyltransferase [Terasakiella brassicae]GGF55964.1 thiopurine S-methyltransferase [Terasakiella brassicae]
MEHHFWQDKWDNNKLGFHEGRPNELLTNYFHTLHLSPNQSVFLPLCGKTRDIAWLLGHGYRVVGAELIESAIIQLFEELEITPTRTDQGDLIHYSASNIDIFVGDIFHLKAEQIAPIDAVYDRAALVALPESMRRQYTKHLMTLTHCAPQLLITYEYDQDLVQGPPFSIHPEEVHHHYDAFYTFELLDRIDVDGGVHGKHKAQESIWRLEKKTG